jgi:NTE family protein
VKADFVGSGTGANFPIVIGAMDAFMTSGIEINSLTATSGSSIVFACIAGGNHPSTLKNLAKDITPGKIIRRNWRPFTPGVFHLDRLPGVLTSLTPPTFGDCDVPLTVVATDSDTGDAVYFSTKDTPDKLVGKAVQASASVPWLFRHVDMGGRRLVDGGVVDNFAIDRPRGPMVIGIRVHGAKSQMRPWHWWPSYTANVIGSMMRAIEREHVEDVVWDNTHVLTIKSPLGGMDFHRLDPTMVDNLYVLGFKVVEEKMAGAWLT